MYKAVACFVYMISLAILKTVSECCHVPYDFVFNLFVSNLRFVQQNNDFSFVDNK